ncbi:MAG: metallophosphoesterase [Kiritimatiellae bacterium]|nr:metallophosphoesterase [Kiritimatiellia bacterium]
MRHGVKGSALSRRGFLRLGSAGAAMTVADWRLWAADEGLPAYYGEHLARVAARIAALSGKCDDAFFFVTDLHIPSNHCVSGRILAKLVSETGVKKVLCGGDLTEAFGGKDSVDRTVAAYRELWVAAVERAGGEFYPAKGNHDFTIRDSPTAQSGFTHSGKVARDILMDTAAVRAKAVTNRADPEACYYYVDFPEARMRYIVADTTDSVRTDRTFWAVNYGMGERQLSWLAENALATIPAGWTALVMQHIPMTGVVSGEDGNLGLFAPWRNLLEAYQNRGKASVGGREYDFGKAGGSLLCNLTGHEHAERQTFRRGLWHVTLPCDAAYGDYIVGSLPWCVNLPVKKKGTVFEQTFDAVHVDRRNNALHFTRIGGGGNRTCHLDALRAKVGEPLRLKAAKWMGDVTWSCYDADRATKRRNPKNKYQHFYSYFNDVAEISADGALAAKKPGESVVLATAANGDKELFAVTCANGRQK